MEKEFIIIGLLVIIAVMCFVAYRNIIKIMKSDKNAICDQLTCIKRDNERISHELFILAKKTLSTEFNNESANNWYYPVKFDSFDDLMNSFEDLYSGEIVRINNNKYMLEDINYDHHTIKITKV